MEHRLVSQINASPFDAIRLVNEQSQEYWSARDLQEPLGYSRWENSEEMIQRAMIACQNSGQSAEDHFRETTKIVKAGATSKPVQDYHLSRYACYLTAMNGDPRKPEIAAAQTYFAIKTREAETVQAVQPQESPLQGVSDFLTYARKLLNVPSLEVLQASEQEAHTVLQYIHAAKKMYVQKDHITNISKQMVPKQLPAPRTPEYIQLEIMRQLRRMGPLTLNTLRTSYMKHYSKEELEKQVNVLLEQCRIYGIKTSHSTKYAVVESASDVS